MKLFRVIPAFFLATCVYAQTPTITSIQNPASNILPGLPNFGIAQGQIFIVYGTNFGPTTFTQASALPFTTSLAGTSVAVTRGGTVVNAPIAYVVNIPAAGFSQMAAVMPSQMTPGNATIQVTYNGVVSNSFSTTILGSNFGISTLNQTGSGPAVITYTTTTAPFYAVVSNLDSARPGNTYTMWGTGLGPANSDNNIATNGDLGTPITVLVGGVSAAVTYRGRSGAPGLDQINFTIPSGVSGCSVSLQVQTNTTPVIVSNIPTIPVALNGGPCSDLNNGYNAGLVDATLTSKGSISLAAVSLDGNKGQAQAFFLRFTRPQWNAFASQLGVISQGSCVSSITVGSGSSGSGVPSSFGMDAGTTLTLTPPSGPVVIMPLLQAGVFFGFIPSVAAGTYKVSDGAGGKDIGAFNASFNGPPANFVWTNQNPGNVNRSQGLQITWTGGDANSWVDINANAPGVPINGVPSNVSASFECSVPASAGSFTIPASVLMTLPATVGSLAVDLNTNVHSMIVPGADLAIALTNAKSLPGNPTFK